MTPNTHQRPDDAFFVIRSLQGDQSAFAILVDRHTQRLERLLHAMLGTRQEMDDLYQETILRAFLNLEQLRDPSRFGAWIYSVAINLARSYRSQPKYSLSWDAVDGPGRDGISFDDHRSSPEDEVLQRETIARIRQAVSDLPPAEREAIVLVYLQGMSHAEAADQLGASLSAIKVRVHRGRNHLRQTLTDEFGPKTSDKLEKAMIKVTIHDIVKYNVPQTDDIQQQEKEQGPSLWTIPGDHYVVLLKEEKTTRVLPIWIGSFEAVSLAVFIKQNEKILRPLTFDLVKTLLELGNVQVKHVHIHRLHEKVYYANLVANTGNGNAEIDCRPSDALNLAIRLGVPIFVSPEIMDSQGQMPGDTERYPINIENPDVEYESLLAEQE